MLCQTFHGAEQVEGEMDCPACCHGSGVFRWRHTAQEAALTALWLSREVSLCPWRYSMLWLDKALLTALQVIKQGVLHMSQIYIASSFLQLSENIQTAFAVTRFNLDLVIPHYGTLGIPIRGWCSPSKVYLHLLPVLLQVVVLASEPFGSQMPVFAPNRSIMFPVLVGPLQLYPNR